jgi:L-lactate utilization protein LutB
MTDLLNAREWYNGLKVEKTLEALKKNGFEALYTPTKKEAVSKVLDFVVPEAVVGIGGSVSLRELGLPDLLRSRGHEVADHWEAGRRGATSDDVLEIRRQQINSDVFITSTNAVTENGELINIDGGGQRVAAMIFGPKRVVVVAGVNKIVGDLKEGLYRVRNVASPMNARRLNRKTPCVVTGVCSDCDSPDRICNATTIIHKKMGNTDTAIILVGEKLGY